MSIRALLLLAASATAAFACQSRAADATPATTAASVEVAPGTHTVVLDVGGTSCAACNLTIRNALIHLDGVTELRGHQEDKRRLDVDYDVSKVEPQQIASLITEAGYETNISGVLTEPDAS